jgi:ferredoxin
MAALRIVVDRELCEANGVCVRIAPGVFRIREDAEAMELLQPAPDESLRAAVEKAVRLCPRGALSLEGVG